MDAITVDQKARKVNRSRCNSCLECAEVCPNGAIEVTGRYMTVPEVCSEVERDRLFYQNSGGGVTLSGGEPLSQWEFALELLRRCKRKGIHTALDTCGYAPWDILKKLLPFADLVLFDIKHMDPEQHRKGTGKSNKLILENARKTAARVPTWLRVPLIPGYNATEENLEEVARLAVDIGAEKVSLLPYHVWGQAKWARIGRRYPMKQAPLTTDEFVERCQRVVEAPGLLATVGR